MDTKKPKSPEFVEITEVPPLVTVKKPKEAKKVREDAWIRIVSDDLVDDEDLDDRVLKVEYTPPEKDENEEDDGDEEDTVHARMDVISRKELKSFLRKKAKLKGKVLKVAMRKAENILASIGG